jgi:hypothetical protein
MGQSATQIAGAPIRAALAVGGALLAVWGCAAVLPPPPTAPFRPRDDVAIESYKFRVAVGDFSDQTGQVGDLAKTIPDILATSLFKVGRIDLYQREPFRGATGADARAMTERLIEARTIDGVLAGTVTRFSRVEKTIVIEVRLVSRNNAVMYADQHTLTFTGRRAMEITRDDVAGLAGAISKAVPRLKDMRIANKNAAAVTLDGGADRGLVPGMTGYVQTYLDKINDPDTGKVPVPTPLVVGEIVIDHVNQDSAIGRILAGEDVRVGDSVRFK